jgi:xeroderma pigmentosum group C-complementing protein
MCVALLHGAPSNHLVTDVTRTYFDHFPKLIKYRVEEEWWAKQLFELSSKVIPLRTKEQLELDGKSVEARHSSLDIPTTIAAFKDHPKYCIELHVKKYEAIHPMEAVGEFRGHQVYPRANLHLLHTRDKWLRKLRTVKVLH